MRWSMFVVMLGLLVAPALADWDHPVKWDQLGPLDSWGVPSWINNDTPSEALTADDFLCTDPWPITDIEFYGRSGYGVAYIDRFRITFWSDVPATANDESHPGSLLYDYTVDPADASGIGWQYLGEEHFKINLPVDHWFHQDEHWVDHQMGQSAQVIYWIGIQGVMVDDDLPDAFYWQCRKRDEQTFGDDAAFAAEYFGYPPWANWGWPEGPGDMYGPDAYEGPFPDDWFGSVDMSFRLTGLPEPASLALLGVGGLVRFRRREARR